MRHPITPLRAALLLASVAVVPARAAEAGDPGSPLVFSVALRAYANRVSGTGYVPAGDPALNPVSSPVTGTSTTYIPSLGVRYGRWVASGSYFTDTRYSTFVPERGRSFSFERREWDVNVGYAVLPTVVATVGYKVLQGGGAGDNPALRSKFSGPTLGVAASAPLTADGTWSLYGNVALGRLKQEVGGVDYPRGDYLSGEFGVQYSLRSLSAATQGVSVLLGYRSQGIRSRNVPVSAAGPATGPGLLNSTRSSKDTSDGLLIGVNVVF